VTADVTQRRRFLAVLVRACLIAAGVFLLAAGALVWDGLHDDIQPADLGVVFGNTVNPDGTLSGRLAARLERTAELYRDGVFPLILVSGAVGKEGRDEALVMRDYLVRRGIPAARLLVDSEGVNTFATAAHTRAVMKERDLTTAVVVSQYFHVPRARLALQRFGIPKVYSAHARYFEIRDLYSIPRELIGLVRYAARSFPKNPEHGGNAASGY